MPYTTIEGAGKFLRELQPVGHAGFAAKLVYLGQCAQLRADVITALAEDNDPGMMKARVKQFRMQLVVITSVVAEKHASRGTRERQVLPSLRPRTPASSAVNTSKGRY